MLSPDKGKYQTFLARFVGPAVASGITIDGGRIDVYSTNLNAKLDVLPLPVIHVYATGGVGYVRLSSTDAKLNFNGLPAIAVSAPVQTQSKPSVNAGAGVDLDLGPITLYGEVKVTWILTEGKTSTEVPLGTVGITF
jgi:opacity protein-like surface antigen